MSTSLRHAAVSLARAAAAHDSVHVLSMLQAEFPGKVVFSTSFSNEDQVITHLICTHAPQVRLFTLDTGRFFNQTYQVWAETHAHFGITIKPYTPDNTLLQPYLEMHGPNAFYNAVALRKECCHIRKVEPLQRALAGNAVWITGLRAAHSPERQHLQQIEWDDTHQVIKYHPLLHWTTEAVSDYVRRHHLPYNTLHDKGFASIGCEPCTRAVCPGEDVRAGRWWWEDDSKKECGLHVRP